MIQLGANIFTCKKENHWLEMGLQGQIHSKWHCGLLQGKACCQRIQSSSWTWLLWQLLTCGQSSYCEDFHCIGYYQAMAHSPNGHQQCLSPWLFKGGSVPCFAWRIYQRTTSSSLQTQTLSLWAQTSLTRVELLSSLLKSLTLVLFSLPMTIVYSQKIAKMASLFSFFTWMICYLQAQMRLNWSKLNNT